MPSLNQMEKIKAMEAEGWAIVQPTKPFKPGGPVMMVRAVNYMLKYVMVYASSELIEPTADEIAGW